MYSLRKTGDIWTLSYEVGERRRMLLIGAGLAGLTIGIFQDVGGGGLPTMAIVGGVVGGLGLIAYWTLSDSASSAVFDLGRRRIKIQCNRPRPWFGPPRSWAFSDVAGLRAVKRSGESTDSWEAVLELHDGTRIRLGREPEGKNELVRAYLEEIRKATGIAEQ